MPEVFAAPGVSIVETDGSTYVTEDGGIDQYFVVLTEAPTTTVTISIYYNHSQISVTPGTLVFTPSNWNVFQTENVSAVDDAIEEGTHLDVIKHSVTSLDPRYNGILTDWVAVQIADNDFDNVSIHARVVGPETPPGEPPQEPPSEPPQEEPPEEPPVEPPSSEYRGGESPPQGKDKKASTTWETIVFLGSPILTSSILVGMPFITSLLAGFPFGFIPGIAFLSQTSGFWEAIFRLPLALFLLRPKKPWSVIYNATTKAPLKLALFTIKTVDGKVIANVIADEKGRFSFKPPDRDFKGEAQVVSFVFPSSIVPGDYDELYGRTYHGEVVEPNKRGSGDFNCPLDPLKIYSPKVRYIRIVSIVGKGVFFIGMIWSIFATYVNPIWYNITICLLYLAVFVFILIFSYKRVSSIGTVREKENRQPLNNVWLYLIDNKTNKIVDMRLTDKTGRYQLFALPGQFTLKAMHSLYKPVEVDIPYYSKERTIHEDIWMERIEYKP